MIPPLTFKDTLFKLRFRQRALSGQPCKCPLALANVSTARQLAFFSFFAAGTRAAARRASIGNMRMHIDTRRTRAARGPRAWW